MAGLPASNAWVFVAPPLSERGPIRGSIGLLAVPTWSPVPDSKLQSVESPRMLCPPEKSGTPSNDSTMQSGPPREALFIARIEFWRSTSGSQPVPAIPAPRFAELSTIVLFENETELESNSEAPTPTPPASTPVFPLIVVFSMVAPLEYPKWIPPVPESLWFLATVLLEIRPLASDIPRPPVPSWELLLLMVVLSTRKLPVSLMASPPVNLALFRVTVLSRMVTSLSPVAIPPPPRAE